MFFRGNKPKDVLKIKELAFSRTKNKLFFVRKMHRFKPAKDGKKMKIRAALRRYSRDQNEFLRVLCAPQASTQSSRSDSATSVLRLIWPRRTRGRSGHAPVPSAIANRQSAIGDRCAGLILACCFLLPLLVARYCPATSPPRKRGPIFADVDSRLRGNDVLMGDAQSSLAASEPIQYLLDLRAPASHRVQVVMTVAGASPSTEFQFPAWNNLYQIRDFARNIEELSAACDGRKEVLTRVDLNTWRSEAKPCEELSLRYAVYVQGSPPFSSAFDSTHAFLNFATLLFYLPKERGRAGRVKFLIPAGWKVASLLEEDAGGFLAANYDLLADSPTEAGQFDEYDFFQNGVTYRVIVHGDLQDYSPERLVALLSKIAATETALMRDVPYSRYTFILHFPREDGGEGGMEHRNGTAITVRAEELRGHWEYLEDIAAHEFFHLWNVKRIRPQSLEPIDYVHGNDTRDLWFCEGVTSAYGALVLLRAGLISRKTFYARLGSAIATLQSRPARFFQSAEESGLEAWFEKYNDYDRPERSISYYNKGELLGFLLDLALRHATGNAAGLDEVMRRLNEDFARPGRFYTEPDLRRVIAQIASTFSGLDAFFEDYVRGTQELDYDTYLGYAGLERENGSRASARLGFEASLDSAGEVRVDLVEPRGAAAQAGLARGDVLLKMDGQRLHDFPADFNQLKPGQEMKLKVRRDERVFEIQYRLEAAENVTCRVKEIPHPSAEQLQVREGWLLGNTTPAPH
jgi:predicted metalloprotease with PDZ domain